MKIFLIPFIGLLASACAGSDAVVGSPAGRAGFDPEELARDTRPQDDFFQFVNGPWLAMTEIPAEYSSYGAMQIIQEITEARLRDLIEAVVAAEPAPAPGSDEQKVADLYQAFMDEPRADALGTTPLAGELARIDALETHDELIHWFGQALTAGITVPVNFYVDADAADPSRNLAYLWQDGLGLPDRDYWLVDSTRLAEVRAAYIVHIERMYSLAGWPDGAAAAIEIARLEKRLAEAHWTNVQNRDRERIYTSKFSLGAAVELSPGFDWTSFLAAGGFGAPDVIVIAQTDYFSKLGEIIRTTPMATWRTYARFRTLKSFAPYLNRDIVLEDFDFQQRTLQGAKKIRARWRLGVKLLDGNIGELLGKLYVRRYFPPEYKHRVESMIENLREAFGASIDSVEWMSRSTKQAARQKLVSFNAKVGYPDVWRDYGELRIEAGDLIGNIRRAREFEHARQVAKLARPVDRSEWGMTPQTINAYYRATWNEIVFPAAVLQPPFFDPGVDDAFNYGAIGSIIGHEFSHGFDDQGRKFDGAGRLQEWWTSQDVDQYLARSANLVAQFDAFQPLPGQAINGRLTLGENIADLAGLTVAYRAWKLQLNGDEAPVVAGFTGPQRFFIGYARTWRTKYREEYLLKLLLSDPHSPPRYRVNGVLPNMPEFYDAFGVTEGDGMYLPDDQRVAIW